MERKGGTGEEGERRGEDGRGKGSSSFALERKKKEKSAFMEIVTYLTKLCGRNIVVDS